MKSIREILFYILFTFFLLSAETLAQPEVYPWGSLAGIRVSGHLYRLSGSIRLLDSAGNEAGKTAHYSVEPDFKRDGDRQITKSVIKGNSFIQTFEGKAPGEAVIILDMPAITGSYKAFYCLELGKEYSGGKAEVRSGGNVNQGEFILAAPRKADTADAFAASGSIFLAAGSDSLEVRTDFASKISLRRVNADPAEFSGQTGWRVYFEFPQDLSGSATVTRRIHIRTGGQWNESPAVMALNISLPGRKFEGMGGNFRLQFPKTDSTIIGYCLKNMKITWGRFAMYWEDWQASENADPSADARNGKLSERIYEQVKIAAKLKKNNMKLIVSAWTAPEWARISADRRPGTYGDALNPGKWDKAVKSITAYLVWLKQSFGIEPELFSFNEPDIGVSIALNYEEHMVMIKMLGRSFAAAGLQTKLLAGDCSNATPYALGFLKTAIRDNEARNYIGAAAFHTWGGLENENIIQWLAAAKELQLPLMITESGMDSEAHRNPDLFTENSYQFQEIELYTRLLAMCQPSTIMQWQLTSDYTLLAGGGIYGNNTPLKPTQRFWNYKQLSMTDENSFWLPVTSDAANISCAAFGDIINSRYIVHIVNNDAKRKAVLKGLPTGIKSVRLFITNSSKKMEEIKSVPVINGQTEFILHEASFTTLMTK